MATSIFSLFGEVFVDNDKANKSIDETTKKGEGLGSKLSSGFAAVGKGAMILGGAAVAAGTALTGVALKTADAAGQINDASARAGVNAEEFQKYAYAAGLGGVEVGTLEKAMARAGKTFAEATEGNKAASAAFQRLGLDISQMSSDQVFDAVVKKLADTEDITTRNAIANDIFGKSYADLAPLLNEGSSGIDALKQEAVDLGAVMSNDAVAAGDNLGDTIDKLKAAGTGLFNQLGSALIPVVQKLADALLKLLPTLQPIIDKIMPILGKLMETIVPILVRLIESLLPPLLDIVIALLPLFDTLVEQVLPPILEIIEQILPFVVQIVQQVMPILVSLLQTFLPIITDIIKTVLPVILKLLDALLTPLLKLLNIIMPPLNEIFRALGGILTNNLGTAFKALEPIIGNIKKHFELLIDFVKNVFTGNWKGAWENVKSIFANIWDAIKNVVKIPINWIINGLNTFISGLNNIKIPDWVPLIGGKGFSISKIPLLANGGTITEAGSAIVGDAGPEILHLPKGATVEPLGRSGNVTLQFNGPVTVVGNGGMQQFVRMIAEMLDQQQTGLARAGAGGGTW